MEFQNPFLSNELVQAVLDQLLIHSENIHGITHWIRVERNSLYLAREAVINTKVLSCFALFHDSCRQSDGSDYGHGKRGAELARNLFEQGRLPLMEEELNQLCEACEGHTDGSTHEDPLIGACWDADRLDLPRVGISPEPRFMSTRIGRKIVGENALHRLSGYVHVFE